jgi:hypothetical protein
MLAINIAADFRAAETNTSHEVMNLECGNPALGLLVVHPHEAGLSWQTVRESEAKISRGTRRQPRSVRVTGTAQHEPSDTATVRSL